MGRYVVLLALLCVLVVGLVIEAQGSHIGAVIAAVAFFVILSYGWILRTWYDRDN